MPAAICPLGRGDIFHLTAWTSSGRTSNAPSIRWSRTGAKEFPTFDLFPWFISN
jgi:hypothetical protein